MLVTEMKLGKPIEILIDREGYRYRFVSKIEEIKSGCVYISPIATRTRYFTFQEEDKVEFVYRNEERMWRWTGVKGGIGMLDGEKVHCLYTNREGKSFNRRNAYRVFLGTEADMSLYYLKPDVKEMDLASGLAESRPEEELYNIVSSTCLIKDLSENGVGIFANERLDKDQELSLKISSPYGSLPVKATVIRSADERYELYRYFYGCSITGASRFLTRYIFELQREQLKKARKGRDDE